MIELRRPSAELLSSYLDMMEEFRANNEKVWEGTVPSETESSRDFLKRLQNSELHLSQGDVPSSVYWAVINERVMGRISIRYELTEYLIEFGGNIGYEVRPSARGKGFATEMLKLVLETPQTQKMKQVLLTCSPDNEASIKTILKNKGEFVRTAFVERMKRQTNYYLIRLS